MNPAPPIPCAKLCSPIIINSSLQMDNNIRHLTVHKTHTTEYNTLYHCFCALALRSHGVLLPKHTLLLRNLCCFLWPFPCAAHSARLAVFMSNTSNAFSIAIVGSITWK